MSDAAAAQEGFSAPNLEWAGVAQYKRCGSLRLRFVALHAKLKRRRERWDLVAKRGSPLSCNVRIGCYGYFLKKLADRAIFLKWY